MYVELRQETPDPIKLISGAAGTSTGKNDYSIKRVDNCIKQGHFSVLEHCYFTFVIHDASISMARQLLRHRVASPTEQSTRYVEITRDNFKPIIPPDINNNPEALHIFNDIADSALIAYEQLRNLGIKREDARFVLPLATQTTITLSVNLREFLHILEERLSKAAQWEIRDVVAHMYALAYDMYECVEINYGTPNIFKLPSMLKLVRKYDETGMLARYHTDSQE